MKQVPGERPTPFVLEHTDFWWQGVADQRLLAQRCTECQALRHPPAPCCPRCRSFGWDSVELSGRGTVHSFVVSHHPQHPAFSYPHVVVLADLEEGTRLVAGFDGARDDVSIGMNVEIGWIRDDAGTVLPVFRAAIEEQQG